MSEMTWSLKIKEGIHKPEPAEDLRTLKAA